MQSDKSRLKVAIFDLDNTCVETETPWFYAWREIYSAHGFELGYDTWRHLMTNNRHPAQHLHDNHQVFLDRVLVERVRSEVMADIRERGLMPGVHDLLNECKEEGLQLAIATNGSRAWVSDVLMPHHRSMFDHVLTIDDVGRGNGKPKPDIHHLALQSVGVDPHEALGIEDSRRGVQALKHARIPAVLIPSQTDPGFVDNAVAMFSSMSEVTLDKLHQVSVRSTRQIAPVLSGL